MTHSGTFVAMGREKRAQRKGPGEPVDVCPTCWAYLWIGDWPFGCKGDPEKHRR